MVHGNYDQLRDPPHHMLTDVGGDIISFSLSRIYGYKTKEMYEARELIDEIRAEDIKMKEAKMTEKRLRLEEANTPDEVKAMLQRDLKQIEGPDSQKLVGEAAKRTIEERRRKQKEEEDN